MQPDITSEARGAETLDFGSYEVLTFDCYGTLIDWETGILDAMGQVLEAHGREESAGAVLERFARLESEIQSGPFKSYRAVLEEVVDGFGREMGFHPTSPQRSAFAGSVARWRPFDDTVEALRTLATNYRLAIVSNVDDDLFEGSAAQLDVPLDEVVTAEQVGSYKPAPAHFRLALQRLAVPVERVLHVAQSLYHDIEPANRLGLASVWVNRRGAKAGTGATAPARARPDLEVPDLATLARLATSHQCRGRGVGESVRRKV